MKYAGGLIASIVLAIVLYLVSLPIAFKIMTVVLPTPTAEGWLEFFYGPAWELSRHSTAYRAVLDWEFEVLD